MLRLFPYTFVLSIIIDYGIQGVKEGGSIHFSVYSYITLYISLQRS